jgi:hypothetical protein
MPSNLYEVMEKASKMDNDLHDYHSDVNFYQSMPMEINSAVAIKKRGPISEAEKEFRRINRLCMYCGNKDYSVSNCPFRPKGNGRR